MNQLYLTYLKVSGKGFLLSAFFLTAFYFADAQVYNAVLSGPNEDPPNASPGIGNTTVTITGTLMRIEASFSGLIGNTTIAHIHAPTSVAGSGNAPVVVKLPTLPGFPAGVQSGSYDITVNMEDPSSYTLAFLSANGGTVATAFAALKGAMDNGKAYFNIHTTVFSAGEIRGFLAKDCPTLNVTIPDAYAMAQGVLPNTVYPGYAPASSLTLSANASGGDAPYTYQWSDGSLNASISVSPVVQTTYSVTVEDQNGCPGITSKTINVGIYENENEGDKVTVCHKGKNSLNINASDVAAHLAHGDVIGHCSNAKSLTTPFTNQAEQGNNQLSVRALPNPSQTYFNLQITGSTGSNVQVKVYDVLGRNVETMSLANANQSLRFGSSYKPGIYLVEIVQGEEKQILRLIKGN